MSSQFEQTANAAASTSSTPNTSIQQHPHNQRQQHPLVHRKRPDKPDKIATAAATGLHTLPMACNFDRSQKMSEILPGLLYLGGVSDAMNRNTLTKYGIKLIINMASEIRNIHPMKFEYIKHDLKDEEDESKMNSELLHSLADRIRLSLHQRHPVFVHCAAGISRSVTIVMAYFLKYAYLHPDTVEWRKFASHSAPAVSSTSSSTHPPLPPIPSCQSVFNYVQGKRLIACPNEGFIKQLKLFEQQLANGDYYRGTTPVPTAAALSTVQIIAPSSASESSLSAPLPPSASGSGASAVIVPLPPPPDTPAARFTRMCEEQAKRWLSDGVAIDLTASRELSSSNKSELASSSAVASIVVSTKEQPLVSVIMPVHNAVAFLPATLVSILHQTHRPLELSFYDDASTDGSVEMIQRFLPAFEACNVQVCMKSSTPSSSSSSTVNQLPPKAMGAGYARNRAMAQARGEFYAFQDADDLSLPRRIELQLEEWRRTAAAATTTNLTNDTSSLLPSLSIIASPSIVTSESSSSTHLPPPILVGSNLERLPFDATPRWTRWINSLTPTSLFYHAFREVPLPCPTWFTSKATFDQIGPFQEVLGEDMHFFYSSLLPNGGILTKVQGDPLLVYRNHATNLTGRTPFAYLFGLRVAALETLVLKNPTHFPTFSGEFSIWNAGKAGKRFYRALTPETQARVRLFCDIDPKKITRGEFETGRIPGSGRPGKKIPIVSWEQAQPPIIICVRQELDDNESQVEFRHRIEVIKGWKEGRDYFFLC